VAALLFGQDDGTLGVRIALSRIVSHQPLPAGTRGPSSSGAGSPIGRRCYEQNIETVALQGQHVERARVYAKG
jgi:hypothetical protein